jgi:Tol biopolymer transport system component
MRSWVATGARVLLFLAFVVAALGRPAPAGAQPGGSPNEQPGGQPGTLALVYVDAEKPRTSEVWTASLDGASRRLVATLGPATRALDLRGSLLALASGDDLIVLDLQSGSDQRIAVGSQPSSARIAPDGAVRFTTRAGCGPGPSTTVLGSSDAATGARSDLTGLDVPGAEIVWHDPASDDLMILPRGCDVAVWELCRLDGTTGAERSRTPIRGCGWVAVAPDGRQALVSSASCSGGAYPELTVYGLDDGGQRELRFAKDAPSRFPFVYSPDGSQAAFGLALARGNPSGTARSGGIWLLDTSSLGETRLWQDQGLESWAIDWSPDGAQLVVGSVEAQGRCGYYVVDVASGRATRVDGVDGCGVNGTLVGFARLP